MIKEILACVLVLISCTLSAQTSKTVNVTTPGTLTSQISSIEQKKLTNLTVNGKIDARDFAFIRDKIKYLAVLDLAGASINAYKGTAGTNEGVVTTYPANEIPAYAFYNPNLLTYKSTLTSVTLPNNLVSIGYLAFYFCWNLNAIATIPASVKSISEYAFYGCYALSSFTVANANTRYSTSSGVLFNEAQDTLFLFPNAKTGLYTIPSKVKHIANSAFENCYNLTAVTLNSTLNSIGTYAFAYCSGITGDLTLPANLKRIDEGAFYGCYNLTGTVTIPANLTEMGYYCFLESNNIKSFSVNTLNIAYASSNDALYSKNFDTLFICPGAKTGSFTIPASVKLIGSHAFYNCKNLTETITIPEATDYIGYYAFYGCTQISSYAVNSSNLYFTAENGILYSKSKDRVVICPTAKSGNYTLPANTAFIDPGAFNNCTALTGYIHIPASLSLIGTFAFYNCTNISGFTVDNTNNFFSASEGVLFNKNQDSLYICPLSKSGSYTIPATVKHIGVSAFEGNTNLTNLILPYAVEEIGSYALAYCTGITSLTIPQNVNSIGTGAFYSCTNLQDFRIARSTPPVVDYYALELINKTNCTLTVSTGTSDFYRNAPYWEAFIHVAETNFNTGIQEKQNSGYQCFKTRTGINITGLTPGDIVEIYTLHGLSVIKTNAYAYQLDINLPFRGIFIVKIHNFTEKIIL